VRIVQSYTCNDREKKPRMALAYVLQVWQPVIGAVHVPVLHLVVNSVLQRQTFIVT
jgi:hypothetical protein